MHTLRPLCNRKPLVYAIQTSTYRHPRLQWHHFRAGPIVPGCLPTRYILRLINCTKVKQVSAHQNASMSKVKRQAGNAEWAGVWRPYPQIINQRLTGLPSCIRRLQRHQHEQQQHQQSLLFANSFMYRSVCTLHLSLCISNGVPQHQTRTPS